MNHVMIESVQAQLIERGLITQGQRGAEDDSIAVRQVDNMQFHEIGVGDGRYRSIHTSDAGGSQTNLFDGAGALPTWRRILAIAAKITDPDRTVGEEIESAQEIFQGASGRQRDGHAAHTRTSNEAIDRNADGGRTSRPVKIRVLAPGK